MNTWPTSCELTFKHDMCCVGALIELFPAPPIGKVLDKLTCSWAKATDITDSLIVRDGKYYIVLTEDMYSSSTHCFAIGCTYKTPEISELEKAITSGKLELDAYKNESDYREEQKTELRNAITEGKTALDCAKDLDEVKAIIEKAKKAMEGIKTDIQLKAEEVAKLEQEKKEELEKAITSGKLELDAYKNESDYREEQKTELRNAITEGKTALDCAKDLDEVKAIIEKTKKAMEGIKTDIQLKAEEVAKLEQEKKEELEKAITSGKLELDAYKNESDYREEQKTELRNAITEGKTALDCAKDLDEVKAIIEKTKKAMEGIKTDIQLKDISLVNEVNDTDNPKTVDNGLESLAMLFFISMVNIALISYKHMRREV